MNLLGTNFRLHNKRLNPGRDAADPAPDFPSQIVTSDVETIQSPAANSNVAMSVFNTTPSGEPRPLERSQSQEETNILYLILGASQKDRGMFGMPGHISWPTLSMASRLIDGVPSYRWRPILRWGQN